MLMIRRSIPVIHDSQKSGITGIDMSAADPADPSVRQEYDPALPFSLTAGLLIRREICYI